MTLVDKMNIMKGTVHPNYPCLNCGRTHMHYRLHVNWKTKIKLKWSSMTKCRKGHTLSNEDQRILFCDKPDLLESYCAICGKACKAWLSYKNENTYLIAENHEFEVFR